MHSECADVRQNCDLADQMRPIVNLVKNSQFTPVMPNYLEKILNYEIKS